MAKVIGPIFRTDFPNQALSLHSGTFRFESAAGLIEGRGKLKLVWLPTPRIIFDLEPIKLDRVPLFEKGRLLAHDLGISIDHAVLLGPRDTEGGLVLHGGLSRGLPAFGRPHGLASVLFHVVCFWDIWTEPELRADGWTVTFKPAANLGGAAGLEARLRDDGGYGVTHWGELRKDDGSQFDGAAAEEFLEHLGLLLSFTRGAWCTPMLYVGFAPDGSTQWQSWTPKKADDWRHTSTWFHRLKGGQLDTMLPGLRRLLLDEMWREPIELGVSWYIESVSGVKHVESSIVLAQVALERLACTRIVEARKAKKKLPSAGTAAAQLVVLLDSVGIPTSLPVELHELAQEAPNIVGTASPDGPTTFVQMRNCVAHPRGGLLDVPWPARGQAKDLGLRYLELVLLSLCGYAGHHRNRLRDKATGGRWEAVPWAPPPVDSAE